MIIRGFTPITYMTYIVTQEGDRSHFSYDLILRAYQMATFLELRYGNSLILRCITLLICTNFDVKISYKWCILIASICCQLIKELIEFSRRGQQMNLITESCCNC